MKEETNKYKLGKKKSQWYADNFSLFSWPETNRNTLRALYLMFILSFFYYNYRNISPKLMIVFATDIFMYVCNLRSNTLICLIRLTHTFPEVCDE